jgi:hypothetical protein
MEQPTSRSTCDKASVGNPGLTWLKINYSAQVSLYFYLFVTERSSLVTASSCDSLRHNLQRLFENPVEFPRALREHDE